MRCRLAIARSDKRAHDVYGDGRSIRNDAVDTALQEQVHVVGLVDGPGMNGKTSFVCALNELGVQDLRSPEVGWKL